MALGQAGKVNQHRKRAEHLGPERRRPMVLDAAYELFLRNGYEGTSMDAIAEAADVSKPVVYDCFSSKDELFTALLDREEERLLGETRAALLTSPDGEDPERTAIRAFEAFLIAVAESPEVYRLIILGEGGSNDVLAARIAKGFDTQAEIAAEIAKRWLETRPGLSEAEVETTAQLLGQTIVGMAQVGARLLLRDPERWTPTTLAEKLGRMVWAARAAL